MTTEFDNLIGRLDRILSELMVHRDNLAALDLADVQTLKHHAEDMAGAAASILRALGGKAEDMVEPKIGDRVRVMVEPKIGDRVRVMVEPKIGDRVRVMVEPKIGDRVRVMVETLEAGIRMHAKVGVEGRLEYIDTEDPRYQLRNGDGTIIGWATKVEVIK